MGAFLFILILFPVLRRMEVKANSLWGQNISQRTQRQPLNYCVSKRSPLEAAVYIFAPQPCR